MSDLPLTLDQILHIAELLSIAGGAVVVSFKIGRFTQAIESTNVNFSREMADSKVDRQGIREEIKILAENTSKEITELTISMQKDNVFSLQIANMEKAITELRQWYDELRRGKGRID